LHDVDFSSGQGEIVGKKRRLHNSLTLCAPHFETFFNAAITEKMLREKRSLNIIRGSLHDLLRYIRTIFASFSRKFMCLYS